MTSRAKLIVRRLCVLATCFCLLLRVFAIALHAPRQDMAPDMQLTFVNCVEAGRATGLLRTREATFEVLNRGDRRVQFNSIAIEQRENGLPEGFNATVARRPPPTALRPGERQRVHLQFIKLANGSPSEFRARCVVTLGAARWTDWIRNQTWTRLFPQKQKKPAVSKYSFSSQWTGE
jgi:hypothetical protein